MQQHQFVGLCTSLTYKNRHSKVDFKVWQNNNSVTAVQNRETVRIATTCMQLYADDVRLQVEYVLITICFSFFFSSCVSLTMLLCCCSNRHTRMQSPDNHSDAYSWLTACLLLGTNQCCCCCIYYFLPTDCTITGYQIFPLLHLLASSLNHAWDEEERCFSLPRNRNVCLFCVEQRNGWENDRKLISCLFTSSSSSPSHACLSPHYFHLVLLFILLPLIFDHTVVHIVTHTHALNCKEPILVGIPAKDAFHFPIFAKAFPRFICRSVMLS